MHEQGNKHLTGPYLEKEFWDDLLRITGGETNEELARFAIRASNNVGIWMEEHGCMFQPAMRGTLQLSRTNGFFLGGGKALINAYYAHALRRGVKVLYEAEAMELRRTFEEQDLKYLANLCHNCRDCYYACLKDLVDLRAHVQAIRDTVLLKYLDGGGHGCNYPNDRFSMMRQWLHQLVFFGFLLCLASGAIAAICNHFMDWSAPYPFWSWPVLLGTVGGVGLLIGNGGLLYLKGRMDLAPAASISFGMDVGFMVLLFLAGLTGLLLLILRDTTAMGILFDLHLGIVLSLFLSLPYGKFVHAVYRYAALVRHSIEQRLAPPTT